jgi:hypothetical protein
MDDLFHNEYSIGFPEGWEDRTEVILVGPDRDGPKPTVTVKRLTLKTEQTLAQFSAFQLHSLRELVGVKPSAIIEERDTTLGGVPAHSRVYHVKFIDKLLTQRQTYAIRGQTAYILTETSARDRFEADIPLFDEVRRRFQFRLPEA